MTNNCNEVFHPEGGSTDSDKCNSIEEFRLEFQHGRL